MFLLRVKLITSGEKRETSTKTCNETMLRDKLKVFVSRISPPLFSQASEPSKNFNISEMVYWYLALKNVIGIVTNISILIVPS